MRWRKRGTTHFVDTVNANLEQLAKRGDSGPLVSGERLAQGIWFDMDSEQAQQDAKYSIPPDGLISFSLKAARPGRWFTLNIDIGANDLSSVKVFGFAARSQAPKTVIARACLRSFHADGFEDVFFNQHLVAFSENSSHADAIWTEQHPILRQAVNWRTLIFFFDPAEVDWVFDDLRILAA
ncbi:MAG: hypothetical protein JJU19_14540 [Pararhodobacter sp.]|nr:hypothetical protein [Pararhodobacter sp.]